jgi:hypothetical protein
VKRRVVTIGVALALAVGVAHAANVPENRPEDTGALAKAEEDFRIAKIANDTDTIDRLVDAEYYGVNQNGIARTKTQLLDLFRVFKIRMLEVEIDRIRIAGDNAVIAGRQREIIGCANDNATPEISMFLRTYVRRSSGWQLLTNAHFVDPTNGGPSTNYYPHDSW